MLIKKTFEEEDRTGRPQPIALAGGSDLYTVGLEQGIFGQCMFKVEVNNIAASMGWLSEMASCLHRRVLQDLNVPDDIIANALPENRPIDTVAKGIYDAW